MKSIEKQVNDILNQEFFGHPSREDEADIEKLKQIVWILALEIDKLKQP